jgi:membrane protease YdiL (CAAX protease family)
MFMQMVSISLDLILAGYVIWEVVRFVPRYKQLKQDLANGDTRARTHTYYQGLLFEWISAALAVAALGFDFGKLNPGSLGLTATPFIQKLSQSADATRGALIGLCFGIGIGMIVLIVARRRANRGIVPAATGPRAWLRKLMPDFLALVPVTVMERFLWAGLAVSAGICEEVVFRGWLLATLHGLGRMNGMPLILAAATIFGLAHAYQGPTGVVLTGFAGAFFCILFVVSGSLLLPILLHAAIDLRFTFLPAPCAPKPQTAYA